MTILAVATIGALTWFGSLEWFAHLMVANWLITLTALAAMACVVLWVVDLEPLARVFPPSMQPFARFIFGVRSKESLQSIPAGGITVVIPAHQEARDIRRTLRKLQKQTLKPSTVIVMDDGSTDKTSEYARSMGAQVYYQERLPNGKTQGKAAAQKRGLSLVETEFVIFIDADTSLARDALEKMMPYFNEPKTAAVGGFVLPYFVTNFWEAVRHFQYMFGFSVLKAGQNNTGTVFVSSGCFTGFRTGILREVGLGTGMAEDLSTTWALLEKKYAVRFASDAVCYVVDPDNFSSYYKQGYRWNAGSFQELKARRFNLFPIGFWFAIFTYFNMGFTLVGPLLEGLAFWFLGEFAYSHFFAAYAADYAGWIIDSPIMPVLVLWLVILLTRVAFWFLGEFAYSHFFAAYAADYTGWIIDSPIMPVLVLWLVIFPITDPTAAVAIILSAFAGILMGLLIGVVFTFLLTWIPVMSAAYHMRHNKRLWLTAWTVFPFMVVHYLDVVIYYAAFWDEIVLKKRLDRWDKGHTEDQVSDESSLSAVSKNHLMFLAHRALAHEVIDVETARRMSALGLEQ